MGKAVKLALQILWQGLGVLRLNAGPLIQNGTFIVVVLILLNLVLPSHISVEGLSSEDSIARLKEMSVNNIIKSMPIFILSSIFLVFAHRRVLSKGAPLSAWIGLRLKRAEWRFIGYAFLIGLMTSVVYMTIYYANGWLLAELDLPVEIMSWMLSSGTRILMFCVGVLITFRFVLFAPVVVLGLDKPFRRAWSLSRGNALLMVLVVSVPASLNILLGDFVSYLGGFIEVRSGQPNLLYAILFPVFHTFTAAYAAMVLSLTYLELSNPQPS